MSWVGTWVTKCIEEEPEIAVRTLEYDLGKLVYISTILVPWKGNNRLNLHLLYVFSMFFLFVIEGSMYFLTLLHALDESSLSTLLFGFVLIVVALMLNNGWLFYNRMSMLALYSQLGLKYQDGEMIFDPTISKKETLDKIIRLVYFYIAFIFVPLLSIKPFVSYMEDHPPSDIHWFFPVPQWIPTENTLVLVVFLLIQVAAVAICGLAIANLLATLLTLFTRLYLEVELLSQKMLNLINARGSSEVETALRDLIIHHQKIRRELELFQALFGFPAFIVQVCSAALIAISVYTMILVSHHSKLITEYFKLGVSLGDKLMAAMMTLLLMVLIGGTCYLMDIIKDKFLLFRDELFYRSAAEEDLSMKRSVFIMLEVSKRTEVLKTSFTKTEATLELFGKILNSAYTFMNLLLAMNKDK